MTDLLIKNIGQLIFFGGNGKLKKLSNGAIAVEDGYVSSIGEEMQVLDSVGSVKEELDAEERLVTPGLVDSHTHLIFAGSREDEFRRRNAGETYLSIAESGGGILSTVRSVRKSSLDELVELALPRLDNMLSHGTTTVEVKSGYGLDTENELKMLKTAHILNERHPVDIIPTFLGAHAIPEEYKERRGDYISLVIDEMIPAVVEQGYARFCDVFCDEGAFTVDEMEEVLMMAKESGLGLKAHLDEFKALGGVGIACDMGAVSVEHLTKSGDEEISAIANSQTVAVLLPATTLHLGSVNFARARDFLSAGCEVAIASDFNPGSAFCECLQSSFIIASSYLKMSPEEVIRSTTLSGMDALRLDTTNGLLFEGTSADIVIWNAPNIDFLMYHWGVNQVRIIVKRGEIFYKN